MGDFRMRGNVSIEFKYEITQNPILQLPLLFCSRYRERAIDTNRPVD